MKTSFLPEWFVELKHIELREKKNPPYGPKWFPAEPTVLVGPSEGEDPSRVAVGLVRGICDKHPK